MLGGFSSCCVAAWSWRTEGGAGVKFEKQNMKIHEVELEKQSMMTQ